MYDLALLTRSGYAVLYLLFYFKIEPAIASLNVETRSTYIVRGSPLARVNVLHFLETSTRLAMLQRLYIL